MDNYALGLWERIFSVAFHIAASALTGWGIAKRKGWLFYVIAAFLHGIVNFSVILIEDNKLTAVQSEIYLTVIAVMDTAIMLWLRWRTEKEIPAENPPAGTAGDTSEILPLVTPDTAAVIPPVVPPDAAPPSPVN